MRISSVDTFPIVLPLVKPIKMSHITIERSENVLVRITTDTGIVGWGEGVEATDITGDEQTRILGSLEFLGPRLVGMDPLRRTELWHRMRSMIVGNETGISAIDMALHDIAGKAYGVSASQLIGGPVRDVVPALTMVGSGNPAADGETAAAKFAAGFRWFKLKLGIADPDTELETVHNVLEAVGPDSVVCGDANQGWTEQESIRFLGRLAGLPIRFIEQPVPKGDHASMMRVAAASPVPICADQSVDTFADIVLYGASAVAGVSLKAIKQGGITGLMRGAALCDTVGLSINLAGKIAGSSVAAAADVLSASAMHAVDYGCSPGNQGIAEDVTESPLEIAEGVVEVPTSPGLGIEVDETKVQKLAP